MRSVFVLLLLALSSPFSHASYPSNAIAIERGIIAHNFVIATVPPLVTSIWAGVVTAGVMGGVIWNFFAKKNGDNSDSYDESNNYTYTYFPPPPKKPNDEDKFKSKHPHGRYEDVGYHKNHQSGRKSPRPIDGQTALDNSFEIPGKERTRIGFSQGQFVVLNETVEGVYHGHVRTWGELRVFMQNILRDQGIVTKAGKFIK
jgi:filamentous hemagglutinin